LDSVHQVSESQFGRFQEIKVSQRDSKFREVSMFLFSARSLQSIRSVSAALVLTLLLLLVSIPVFSQTSTGRILGTVRDQSDAVVAGAAVTITDVQRGVSRSLVTDQAGDYLAPNLEPGEYKVSVQNPGFKVFEKTNILLEVATDVRIDVVLQPGDASQVVTVTADVALLNTTSATLGGTLSNETINDLPLNGRNYENLLQLRPGVVRYPGGGFSTTSTNGLRAEDNAYYIEGLFNSEPYSGQGIINGASIAGDSATILPIDAIQEFNLMENPPAEYGWKPGAIVNVGLKSGTNSLHGTAYAFGRGQALDARNYFNTVGQTKTPTELEQWGVTVGGPIVKDKLFFFGGYERQQYTVGNTFGVNVPSQIGLPAAGNCAVVAGDCANSVPNAIADLQALGIPISTPSLTISGCTLGPPVTCNGKGFPTNNTTSVGISNGFPNTIKSDNAIGKVDYHFNDRNTLSGMYFFGNSGGPVEDFPELQSIWKSILHTRAQVVGASYVWVPNSRWVNEVRFGYNRLYQPTFNADHNMPASDFGLDTGVPVSSLTGGLPRIRIDGFTGLGGFKWPKIQGPDTRVQIIDHISYTTGKHAFKFGGEVHRNAANGGAYGNARGSLEFTGGEAYMTGNGSTPLEDFFAGLPNNGSILSGQPQLKVYNWAFAGFVQDDWRITKNLTVNLGLRYDYNGVIKDPRNLLGNFDPTLGLVQAGQQVGSVYNGDHKNFAPRIGVAWDPFGTGKTVIRAGGGIVYETVNWQSFLAFDNSFGLNSVPTGAILNGTPGPGTIALGNLTLDASSLNYNTGPVFPTGTVSCTSAAPCATFSTVRNLKTPYVAHWTLNVQHAFSPGLSLEVAYVGNHGGNLTNIRDINQAPQGSAGAEQQSRPFFAEFPYLSNIYQMGNLYRSNYNGLQTTLTSRDFHGFTTVAGYTYSHSLDQVGANWDFGYGLGLPQNSFDLGKEYASSDFDIRHRFTLSVTYSLPNKESFAQMLSGWQLNSIVSLYSAQPWGVIDEGTDVSGTGSLVNRWDFFGKTSDFTSTTSGIPFFPGLTNPGCVALATTPAMLSSLTSFGCYQQKNSYLLPPALGTFGTMGRNTFRDTGYRNWDFSVVKNWKFGDRLNMQGRVEFFNVLNHPNFANPYGGQNGFGLNDPSAQPFGCGCVTPDVAAANPVIGSGGARAIQLGLKFQF
jgi:Carboxypeptidase regulatory-like domain/TonB dependent receptor